MSSGIFGSIRPANIDPNNDVDMLYTYRPTRASEDDEFEGKYKSLSPGECLIKCTDESGATIEGMYDIRLPLDKFNRKGFYTLYIMPRRRKISIVDVSVLAAYPDVKGLVFNSNDNAIRDITDLTGYRIDYGSGVSRLIKSCNRCSKILASTSDGYAKEARYVLENNSSNSLFFCTVTPSSAPSFRPNAYPYIGVAGEEVTIVSTLFSPKMIEIEMVDHDFDTISYMLEGDQIRDRDNGIITTYNDDNEIYQQYDYYTIKSKLGVPLYDVKKNRVNVDFTQSHDDITNM